MKFFAQSALEYVLRQIEHGRVGRKLLLVMPSLPAPVVREVGDRLTAHFLGTPDPTIVIIRVAMPLVREWLASTDPSICAISRELSERGWCDENENLTAYRNRAEGAEKRAILLLIGVDRVTDAASLADFHHCNLQTVWEHELNGSLKVGPRGPGHRNRV